MIRQHHEHIIGAAANITGEDEFVVIGSQAILGTYPDAPEQLLRSMEAVGYYAHGVGPETAIAPAGWRGRLVPAGRRPSRSTSRVEPTPGSC